MSIKKDNLIEKKESGIIEDKDLEIVKEAQNGNILAVNKIIDKYNIMVKSKAKSYFLIGADKEDIIQEGMVGLYKAIRDYNEEKTCTFKHFAELCVTRQMITAIKTANRKKHTPLNSYISLNKPVFEDDSEKTLFDMITSTTDSDPQSIIVGKEDYNYIEKKISEVLSPFEEEVINLYIKGKKYSDIAKELKKDSKAVDNAIQRVKRKLEKLLENNNE